MGQRIPEKEIAKFKFAKLRKRTIEQKRTAQFLAYRELCIFVKKSAGAEKRNREIGSFFSLRAMGALTGASPERARIVVSEWQAYGENGIYECTFRDIENSATGGKK